MFIDTTCTMISRKSLPFRGAPHILVDGSAGYHLAWICLMGLLLGKREAIECSTVLRGDIEVYELLLMILLMTKSVLEHTCV